jgi:ubiquinone/menaquinone biosynthesis C-methylase UbiE
MANKSQKDAFIAFEADAWWERNKDFIINYNPAADPCVDVIEKYRISPKSILEIGCSSGYRLNALSKAFNNCKCTGIDASNKAIIDGRKHYSQLDLSTGTADELAGIEDGTIDVVIVGFVFYVIDRNLLLKTMSEIDRVLKNKGYLIIVDFFSARPLRNSYHHITNFHAFSFKQTYYQAFSNTNTFFLIDFSTHDHSTEKLERVGDLSNAYTCSLLLKDLDEGYK